jgi:sec-independent protein translocase protein TatB
MEKKWREQNEAIMNATPQLPDAAEMQAPIASRPSDEPAPADEPSETPVPPVAKDSETPREPNDQRSRQAELYLPPPPP